MPGGPGAGGRSIFNIGKVFPQGAKDVKSKVEGGGDGWKTVSSKFFVGRCRVRFFLDQLEKGGLDDVFFV